MSNVKTKSSRRAKAAEPKAALILPPKAAEIVAILTAAKGEPLTGEAILLANLARRESGEATAKLSGPDLTAYIGSPIKYKFWDGLIETTRDPKASEELKSEARAKLGGWKFISLIGRGVVALPLKDGVNSKGRSVYRFKLAS